MEPPPQKQSWNHAVTQGATFCLAPGMSPMNMQILVFTDYISTYQPTYLLSYYQKRTCFATSYEAALEKPKSTLPSKIQCTGRPQSVRHFMNVQMSRFSGTFQTRI